MSSCAPHFQSIPLHSNPHTLVVALADDPSTLDWNKATDGISLGIVSNLMSGLTRFDRNLNVVPNIAEGWKSDSTQQEFLFTIRKDRTWSDGRPVLAEDFRNSFLRLLDPGTASPYAYYLFDIKGAKCFNALKCSADSVGIKVLSPHRIKIELTHPMAAFPALLSNPITDPVRDDLIRKFGPTWMDPGHLVTNGNYLLKKWVHGSLVEIQARHDLKNLPDIHTILFLVIPEPVTQLLLYDRHILDIAGVPSFYVKKYKKNTDFHQILQFSNIYYSMNVRRPPFDNVHVRRAFAMAVDRDEIERLFQNALPVSRSFIPRGLIGYDPKSGFGYHPNMARRELSEGGYPKGRGFPETTFFFPTGTQSRILAVYLQHQFREVLGVTLQLRSLEWKAFLARLDSRTPSMYQSGWLADYPDPHTFMSLMAKDSGNNRTGWENPEFDRLIVLAVSTQNLEARIDDYTKAQNILTRDGVPIIPLAQGLFNVLVHSDIKGYWHDPLGNDHYEKISKK